MNNRRRYQINEAAFDDVAGNETGCYLLGLLLTDGCISCKKMPRSVAWTVRLALSGEDGPHVTVLRDFVAPGRPVLVHTCHKHPTFKPRHSLNVDSERLAKALMRYGIKPRKSGRERACVSMKNNVWFWRGCVDGDGYVGFATNKQGKKVRPILGLVGSSVLLEQFAEFVRRFTPTKATPHPMSSIWSFCLHGYHAYQMAKVLYSAANVALPRKRLMAERIITECCRFDRPGPKNDWSHMTANIMKRMYDEHGSWRAVARSLGTSGNLAYTRARLGLPVGGLVQVAVGNPTRSVLLPDSDKLPDDSCLEFA